MNISEFTLPFTYEVGPAQIGRYYDSLTVRCSYSDGGEILLTVQTVSLGPSKATVQWLRGLSRG